MNLEQIHKVLGDIQKRVPADMRRRVVEEVDATPTIRMVMEKVVDMESIDPEKREAIKGLLEAGEFSKKIVRENPKYAKMVDEFVSREINKEIRKGNLPGRKELKRILDEQNAQNKNDKGENRS